MPALGGDTQDICVRIYSAKNLANTSNKQNTTHRAKFRIFVDKNIRINSQTSLTISLLNLSLPGTTFALFAKYANIPSKVVYNLQIAIFAQYTRMTTRYRYRDTDIPKYQRSYAAGLP